MNNTERYVGFYTHKPFWAGTSVVDHLPEQEWNKVFTSLMTEVAFAYEALEYKLKVCRDGMFLFKFNLDKQAVATGESESLFQRWSQYIPYVNTVLILFESAFSIVRTVFASRHRQKSYPSDRVQIRNNAHRMNSYMEAIVQSLLTKVGIFANRRRRS